MSRGTVTAFVRAHAIPRLPKREGSFVPKIPWRLPFGRRVLIFDTETTERGQRLLVAAYELRERGELMEAGLVYGDDLPPQAMKILRKYAAAHHLPLRSREQFCHMLLIENERLGTVVAAYNIAFDLGALAWKSNRGQRRTYRGFHLHLVHRMKKLPSGRYRITDEPTKFAPKLKVTKIGQTSIIEWGRCRRRTPKGQIKGRRTFPGRWVDLAQAVRALGGGKRRTLEAACAWAGLPYKKREVAFGRVTPALVDYAREDVVATWRLYGAVEREWKRWGLDGELDALRSPASISKRLRLAMGIEARLAVQPDFPPERLGQAMEALYGGIVLAPDDLQGIVLPVRTVDIRSTYLSVNVLEAMHRWDAAAVLRAEEYTVEAQALLDAVALDSCYDPTLYPRLAVLAEIVTEGDMVPVRFPEVPQDAPSVHVMPVWSGRPLWYALPDLVRSKLETGRAPRIRRAWRLVPEGELPNLKTIRLPDGTELDPRGDYLRVFRDARRAAQERGDHRLAEAMKGVGEPLSYGDFIEVDEQDRLPRSAFERDEARADVWMGQEHFVSRIAREEYPGRWYFPPRAAIVTGTARLLLGLMLREVRAAGGRIVTAHTDSVAIVATEQGGEINFSGGKTIRALAFAEVDRIRHKFDALSPGLWKMEEANIGPQLSMLSLGEGRNTVFNVEGGRIVLRDRTETALGHLVPPASYATGSVADAVWEALIREARGDRGAVERLPFAAFPALGRFPLTTPALLRHVRWKKDAPRPFGFGTTVYPRGLIGGEAFWSGRCRLHRRESVGCPTPSTFCPFRPSCPLAHPIRPMTLGVVRGDRIYDCEWSDLRTGRAVRPIVTTVEPADLPEGMVAVKTWGTYLRTDFRLRARELPDSIRIVEVVATGKEHRQLEEVEAGIATPGDVSCHYRPDEATGDPLLRRICRRIPAHILCEETHFDRRTIQRFRNRPTLRPHATHRRLLWQAVQAYGADHPEIYQEVDA